MNKKLFYLQSLVILAGTIFAWDIVVQDFLKYFRVENSLFKFQNCLAPNPLLTPCFYGAIVFLIAFIWSLAILNTAEEKQLGQQKKLLLLLIAGTIFGWGNFAFELIKFMSANTQPIIGCSGNRVTNPIHTPCFYGALCFSLSAIASLLPLSFRKKLD